MNMEIKNVTIKGPVKVRMLNKDKRFIGKRMLANIINPEPTSNRYAPMILFNSLI